MAPTPTQIRDPFAGYGLISILLHWLTAIAVVALYLTHDREGSDIHLSIGLAVAPLFLWRLYWRVKRGYPRVPEQSVFFNFVERLVMLGFLVCFLTVTVTGLVIPPLDGKPLAFVDIVSFTMPFAADRELADIAQKIHNFVGNAFLLLIAMHIASALFHRFVDRDEVVMRMLRPVPRGK